MLSHARSISRYLGFLQSLNSNGSKNKQLKSLSERLDSSQLLKDADEANAVEIGSVNE